MDAGRASAACLAKAVTASLCWMSLSAGTLMGAQGRASAVTWCFPTPVNHCGVVARESQLEAMTSGWHLSNICSVEQGDKWFVISSYNKAKSQEVVTEPLCSPSGCQRLLLKGGVVPFCVIHGPGDEAHRALCSFVLDLRKHDSNACHRGVCSNDCFALELSLIHI